MSAADLSMGFFRWRHLRLRAMRVSLPSGDVQVDAEGWFPPVLDPRDEKKLRELAATPSGARSYERVALNSESAFADRIKAAEANVAALENEAAKAELMVQMAYDAVACERRRLDDLLADKKRYADMAAASKARAAEKTIVA